MVPWFVRITPFFKAILPRAVFRFMSDWLNVSTGMSQWRGHAMQPLIPPEPKPAPAPFVRETETA